MNDKPTTKLIRYGDYVAEVDIVLHERGAWGMTMSKEDACKLDDVRQALHEGDMAKAVSLARVYRLTPVDAEAA